MLWSSAYDWNMNLSMISVMVVMLFLRNSAIRILTVISPFESTTVEKLLACVMICPNAPGFVKTFPRIFDRDIPEQEYPFSYFNQAHSRVPPMSL
ncbi:hypothetical protein T08_2759 [Trichinella sp. T8]|nr:hypothetical protein T08_2759 [Trichinella sp. T8]